MAKIVILLTWCCLYVSCKVISKPHLHHEWNNFKVEHGKMYDSPEEETLRLGIYLQNKEMIEAHNQKYRQGLVSFHLRMNHFGDLTDEEYKEMLLASNLSLAGYPGVEVFNVSLSRSLSSASYVNWFERGAVTRVKNQGFCGSCWAFSVAGALESHTMIRTGQLIELSEQNLLDCSSTQRYRNKGCFGGWMPSTFQYVIDNGGIDTAISYPYLGFVGECKYNPRTVGARCRGYASLPRSEDTLRLALETVGPVSVAIDALRPTFKFYAGGVYFDPSCGTSLNPLNHAVLAIGFSDDTSNPYWIIKNSWGIGWGEAGFLRLAKDRGNHCGVASAAFYPIV